MLRVILCEDRIDREGCEQHFAKEVAQNAFNDSDQERDD